MKTLALITTTCALAALQPCLAAPQSSTKAATVTIVKGDTLYSLARKHSTTPQAIMAANGLKDANSLAIGRKLTIPHRSDTSVTTSDTPTAKAPPLPPMRKLKSGHGHIVQRGETLYSISRKLNMSVAELKAANPDINVNSIATGSILKTSLPQQQEIQTKKTSQAQRASAKTTKKAAQQTQTRKPVSEAKKIQTPKKTVKQSSPKPTSALPPVKAEKEKLPEPKFETKSDAIKSIRINNAMTYGQVAAKHGTSVTRLNKLNGLKLTNRTLIAQGAELYVPGR